MKQGIWYAVIAYAIWGILPLYWKIFEKVGAWEVLSHRVVWSLVFVGLIILFRRQGRGFFQSLDTTQKRWAILGSSLLISINWLIYIWAVNAGHVVEASLGYYMNPLVNVLLGVLFLGERLRKAQWVSIALALIAVLILTVSYGKFPWVSLSLALSFGLYGLSKKKVQLNTVYAMTWETLIIAPIALLYLIYIHMQGADTALSLPPTSIAWLVFSGICTAVPLFCFAEGAKRLPLSMLGLIQYIAPTIMFLLGVFLYREPFSMEQAVAFALIWFALIIFSSSQVKAITVRKREERNAA
jgi:chloramphenicol-sensitive protein RarD